MVARAASIGVVGALASVIAGAVACRTPARPLPPAGYWTSSQTPYASAADDAAGQLSQQSTRLFLDGAAPAAGTARNARERGDRYGGDSYGGDGYGGDGYGGASYATWSMPTNVFTPVTRQPAYAIRTGLAGSIDGVVTWAGAPAPRIATACGTIDNPTLRIGEGKRLRGALVFVTKVTAGRAVPFYGKPAFVGGVVAKHGCALVPAAQIVVPVPATISIHGDGKPAKLRVTGGSAIPRALDLAAGGRVLVEAKPGTTRVEADDGSLSPAWLVALDHPYYAITDDGGRYRLDELAPGTYDVTFWQAAPTTVRGDGALAAGAPIIVHRTVRVDATRPARLDVTLR